MADGSIKQASGIMVEIVGGDVLTDSEISATAEAIRHVGSPDTEMLICDLRDEKMGGAVRLTVIMIETGIST